MKNLTILQINDLHGYLAPHPEMFALDNGNTCHGTMPAVQTRGEAMIAPMRALGLDGMTVH